MHESRKLILIPIFFSLDEGCNGGLPENAYKAIAKLGGLESEEDYEYDGVDETCHFNKVSKDR